MFGSVFYRGYSYGADDHVTVLRNSNNDFSSYILRFMQPLIEKVIEGTFTYSRNFYPSDALHIEIPLPMYNGEIAYEFMEKFIRVIEKLVIKDLVIWADKKIRATKLIVKYKI